MSDGRFPAVQFQSSGVERVMKRVVLCCCFAIVVLALPLPAQQSPAANSPTATSSAPAGAASPEVSKEFADRLSQLHQKGAAAQSAGGHARMLVSGALVLLMTGPGLALFYGGLVRRKNTLAIMMQSFAMMGLISVLWALVGYSLAFGGSGPVIGDFSHAFLRG